jgi:hypothetical protein
LPVVICLRGQAGHGNADGFEGCTSSGSGPVVIDRVSLASPKDLRIVGAYIVPDRYLADTQKRGEVSGPGGLVVRSGRCRVR